MARTITETVKGVSFDYNPITEEAGSLVFGDRGTDYGHPVEDFSKTAGFWTIYKGVAFTPEDVAMMLDQMKTSRQMNKVKRDNPADKCGYMECLQRIVEARAAGVEIQDWSWVAPTVEDLLLSAAELARVQELVPIGVSVEDLVACWDAHRGEHEPAPAAAQPTSLALRAYLQAKEDGIEFTPGQENLINLLVGTMEVALKENWSVNAFNRSAAARGVTACFTDEQWDAMTFFVAAETYKEHGQKVNAAQGQG